MKNKHIRNLVFSGVLLALGMVLPLATAQIKEIGDSLLPMHLPVLLCGLLCGWRFGLPVGLVLPFLRSIVFGMPPIYPNAVWMAAELAAYGAVIGLLYHLIRVRGRVYFALIGAQLAGRIVWGVVKALLLGVKGTEFPFSTFLIGGFADALPGILLQIILLPPLFIVLQNAGKAKMDCEG
ncbi:MAG: ECF transporter S component [Ruminococcaceae bacterium]|nr:ECF transporter S component [Oscillospiraceae bacterium]